MDEIQKVLVKAGRKDLAQKYYEKVASKSVLSELAKIFNFKKVPRLKKGKYDIYDQVKKSDAKKVIDKAIKAIKGSGYVETNDIPSFLRVMNIDKLFVDKKGKFFIITYTQSGSGNVYVYATVYDREKYEKANEKAKDELRKWIATHSSFMD